MMPDSWTDEKGELIVDLGSSNRASRAMKDRKALTEYANVDLASGFPKDQIWTTRDGRRIAVPNMSDSHLINTIQFLRRRAAGYKRKVALQFIMHASFLAMMFDHVPDRVMDEITEDNAKKVDELSKLDDDEFLSRIFKIFKVLLQEAYKRKLLVPNYRPALKGVPDTDDQNYGDSEPYDNEDMYGKDSR